jgi:hypothetical protein
VIAGDRDRDCDSDCDSDSDRVRVGVSVLGYAEVSEKEPPPRSALEAP